MIVLWIVYFSKEEEQEGDQIDPVTSHEEHEIESSTLVLPKMRRNHHHHHHHRQIKLDIRKLNQVHIKLIPNY